MDYLKELIDSLNKKERRKFKSLLGLSVTERKDLGLFELYASAKQGNVEEQMQALSIPNTNAYYSTRKRLYRSLAQYASIIVETPSSPKAHIQNQLSVIRHLLNRGLNRIAWNVLENALKYGQSQQLNEELSAVYELAIVNIHLQDKRSFSELKKMYQENLSVIERKRAIRLLMAEYLSKLRAEHLDERDMQHIMEGLMGDPENVLSFLSEPTEALTIVHGIRRYLHAKERLDEAYDFLKVMYEKMDAGGSATLSFDLAHLVASDCFQQGNLHRANKWLDECSKHLRSCPKSFQKTARVKHESLKSFFLLLKQGPEAALQNSSNHLSDIPGPSLRAKALLNHVVFCFYASDWRACKRTLGDLNHSDAWYLKRLGHQWVLHHRLIELLLYFENGDVDLFENRMRSLERLLKQESMLELRPITRAYLNAVKDLWSGKSDELIRASVEDVFQRWETEAQYSIIYAQMFYSWLVAKRDDRSNYEALCASISDS